VIGGAAVKVVVAGSACASARCTFTGKVSETLLEKGAVCETTLSAREKSVVQLIAEGHTNKKIADLLAISQKTVVPTVPRRCASTALIRYAIRNKIVEA
jgi:DNA-binding NarL/FixJ family response regulator